MDRSDVQATLREMWETRPSRRHDDRQVAGVAAAIGRRYDIDPTLVRIGFVVATLAGGAGAVLYVAGWIALPEDAGHNGVPARPRRTIAVIGLIAALLGTFGWIGNGPGPGPVLGALIVIGLLFLLHRSRADQLTGDDQGAGYEAPTVTTADGVSLYKETGHKETGPSMVKDTTTASAPVEPTPPSWDPLGAAPFAWDLPEPTPLAPAPAPAPRRLPVTPVTLGVALLAGAVTAFVLLVTNSWSLVSVPVMLGVLLAVVGTGLVVGAFARSGRGLIPIALLLSALTWGSLTVPPTSWHGGGVGDRNFTPLSVAQVQPVYEHSAGDLDIDLSHLDLSVPAGGDATAVRTRIEQGAGDVTVTVPRNADVTVDGSIGLGDLTFGEHHEDGSDVHVQATDLGQDGIASGRPVIVEIEQGLGSAEVRRG